MSKKDFLSILRKKNDNFPDEELKLLKEQIDLKLKLNSGQLKETNKLKEVRKSLAQLKTLQKEKENQTS